MRDEKIFRERHRAAARPVPLVGHARLMFFATTRDELRGWIHVLEWVLKTAKPLDPSGSRI